MIFLLATIANAASMNGDFKGNPIVKVKSSGKDLTVESTPAVIYNGNTMVPIYMFKQLGATVAWDQKTYSVDVSMPIKSSQRLFVRKVYSDGESYHKAGIRSVKKKNRTEWPL